MRPRNTSPIVVTTATACLAALLSGCGSSPELPEAPPPAIPEPVAAREVRPQDPAIEAIARGAMLNERGLSETALAEFIRAIELNPELASAHLGAGDILFERGDYESSTDYFATAARLEPENFDAHFRLGQSLQGQGLVEQSVSAYERALELSPADVAANLNLAGALLTLDRPEDAEEPALRAVAADPTSGAARLALASAYDGQRRFEDAIVEYRQAAELIDLNADTLLGYSQALARAGRVEEGEQVLEQLALIEPSAPAFERLGAARFRLRQYDQSLAAYRLALEIDPDYYPALNGVGVNLLNTYLWSDRTDTEALAGARSALRKSLQVERRQPKIVELLTRYR